MLIVGAEVDHASVEAEEGMRPAARGCVLRLLIASHVLVDAEPEVGQAMCRKGMRPCGRGLCRKRMRR